MEGRASMNLLLALTDYSNPRSLGFRLRAARARRLMALIDRIHKARGRCRILDLGGSPLYWRVVERRFLTERGCTITLLNHSPGELANDRRDDRDLFTALVGDACATGIEDKAYDLVHSNSVIEHVGNWPQVEAFAGEVRRLAPAYFVQTPYVWFPIEPHFGSPFWHWLPEPVRAARLMRRGRGYFPRAATMADAMRAVQEIHLLDRRGFGALFPDAAIDAERIVGLTKSLIAIRDA
jgi:hypothetical protein